MRSHIIAAAGSVSGPTTPSSSITQPGQPCVMISGSAFSCGDLTWMKWTSSPSIPVVNCGSAFSSASRQVLIVEALQAATGGVQGGAVERGGSICVDVGARVHAEPAEQPLLAWGEVGI
jgi:hypothetical protein